VRHSKIATLTTLMGHERQIDRLATWAAFPLRPRKRRSTIKMQIRRSVPIASPRAAIKLADFHSAISCDQFIHSADDSHGQRFSASAHVHLAHRKSTHFDTGSCGDDIGYNELTAIIFGQVLETSSHMH
jgi:hypothetical protein